jgi:site-specific DNA recombinase
LYQLVHNLSTDFPQLNLKTVRADGFARGDPMLTAVDYSRYSSDRQHESSIEAQQAAIDQWAAAHHVLIIERYADRALSGKTDNRPEFQRLLSDLRHRKVDLVLVHKTDRFARNRYDAAIYSRVIKQRGARLVCVAQDFGDGPEAVILEALMQGMAEYYSLNLATEVIKGRKIAISKGKHAGGTYPFGYAPDGQGGYKIVELEAYYIQRLYQAVIDGYPPFTHITKEMRELGIRGRRGRFLAAGNVAAMLKLPIYAGIYEARAGDATSRIENHHPAIVSKEIHEEAVRIMEARKNVGRKPRIAYLCTGLIRCGMCGAPAYGHTSRKQGKEYPTYICSKHCGLRSIRTSELDQAAREYVASLLRPEVREQLTKALTAYLDGQRAEARRRVPAAKKEISRLQSQIDSIMENMSTGVLPASVLERMGRQISDLESQIDVLQTMITEPPQLPPSMINQYFENAALLDEDTDPDLARQTLERFISVIHIHPHALEFVSTFDAWLLKNFPTLHPGDPARLSTPPEGADNPKGVENPSEQKKPADDNDPDDPDDPDDPPSGPRPKNASRTSKKRTPPRASVFQKTHDPASGSNKFLENAPTSQGMQMSEFRILFQPTFIKRTNHQPHTGIVAVHVFDRFGDLAQDP